MTIYATLLLAFFAAFISKDFMGIRTFLPEENWEHPSYHVIFGDNDNDFSMNKTVLTQMGSKRQHDKIEYSPKAIDIRRVN